MTIYIKGPTYLPTSLPPYLPIHIPMVDTYLPAYLQSTIHKRDKKSAQVSTSHRIHASNTNIPKYLNTYLHCMYKYVIVTGNGPIVVNSI